MIENFTEANNCGRKKDTEGKPWIDRRINMPTKQGWIRGGGGASKNSSSLFRDTGN